MSEKSPDASFSALPDRYAPQDVEARQYQWWESRGYFKAQDRSTKPPYSIILPPPNVTGFLHLGHALDHTIQDILIRWKRMSGFNALWLPGTDHAGIATQTVVEKELAKQNITRQQLGREKFLEKVWEWKNTYGNRIVGQMKRLGDSCDWDRLTFTLDPGVSKAVRRVFVQLYKKGAIYRGTRLINWSWPLETAISDLEVEHQEVKGTLYHIAYAVVGSNDQLVVATTRPETLLGDSAVAVHPEDERYRHLIGKRVSLPLTSRTIPIIGDTYVEREFGSGVVKITPAHDFNDYEVGQRHQLEMINILNKNGTLNENAGAYAGMKIQAARKKVIEDLQKQKLLIKEEPHTHSVGFCSRTGTVAEPFLSEQWFLQMKPLAVAAQRVVESGTTVFEPEQWTKTYLHWMSIIQDWCISRQLWWGHRIPAWHCTACGHITVGEEDVSVCEKCSSKNLRQDDDVLDTWFSSALWPFSTMGWPDPSSNERLSTFYPTSVLVTGHDIIFFWVARMMVMGLEFMHDVPFRKVYVHGLIRDSQGRKMSKSLGNSLDPVQLIERYGADSLRFTLAAQIASGRDLKFSEQRLEGYRNFMNKIWNATRFALTALEGFKVPEGGVNAVPRKADLSGPDQWITFKLGQTEKIVEEALENEQFSEATNALYSFVWNDFCDWYLELIKPIIWGEQSGEKAATQLVLAQTLNRIMRLLHPFTPFISEELYQKLPIRGEALIVDSFPTPSNDRTWLAVGSETHAQEMELVKDVITALRNIRGENQISPSLKIKAWLTPKEAQVQKILGANKASIMRLAKLEECEIAAISSMQKCALTQVVSGDSVVDVIVPLEGVINIEEEVVRLRKAIEKVEKDVAILSGKLSNEKFVANAPEEIVAQDRKLLEQYQQQVARMKDNLGRLT